MAQRKSLASLGHLREKLDQFSNSSSTLSIEDIAIPKSQTRRYFDEERLSQLENSVRSYGILEPLIVRPIKSGKFELVAGERRLRVAQRIGLTAVPVVIKELTDVEAAKINLVENLQREDLNPFEETEGIVLLLSSELKVSTQEISPLLHRLQHQYKQDSNNVIGTNDFKLIEAIFASIGRMTWESFVNNRLPLLNLPEDVSEALRRGKIAYTKAKVIAQVKDEDARCDLLKMAIDGDLSLVDIKNQVKQLRDSVEPHPETIVLKNRMSRVMRALNKSEIWNSSSKHSELEKLLDKIEKILL
jgi:ParB family transcriptional regulator, chromosome partitioning protein